MSKIHKLNIGCGNDKLKGYVNLDVSPLVSPDVVCDIEYGIPFDDNTFDEILANNVLTQIFIPMNFVFVMNDLWRITKKTGVIRVRVPNAKDLCAWQDPMDCRRFTDQSFTYLQYNHRRYKTYGKHYGFKPFKVTLVEDNGRQMIFNLTPKK
jgi:predicted SAM-dependent methyltransferase